MSDSYHQTQMIKVRDIGHRVLVCFQILDWISSSLSWSVISLSNPLQLSDPLACSPSSLVNRIQSRGRWWMRGMVGSTWHTLDSSGKRISVRDCLDQVGLGVCQGRLSSLHSRCGFPGFPQAEQEAWCTLSLCSDCGCDHLLPIPALTSLQ